MKSVSRMHCPPDSGDSRYFAGMTRKGKCMTAAGVTPADLTITPRDRRFAREAKPARWWHGGDPFATAFYNALSAPFPKGEAFFVEAVRNHRHGAPAKLAEEIKGFTTQEVIHIREHDMFNRAAVDAGYDLGPLE